jgi:hypothetical protein
MRGTYLIGMLALLFLANLAMLMGMTNWPQRTREGFAAKVMGRSGSGSGKEGMDNIAPYSGLQWGGGSLEQGAQFRIGSNAKTVHESFSNMNMMRSGSGSGPGSGSMPVEHFANMKVKSGSMMPEPFMDYLSNGFATEPIGSYDGLNMAANLPPASQGFRARLPNVPHPTVTIDGDHLLPFVNNECKPECCGSTMSCNGGGCVCTTPEDRDLINTRGGNRRHEDGF